MEKRVGKLRRILKILVGLNILALLVLVFCTFNATLLEFFHYAHTSKSREYESHGGGAGGLSGLNLNLRGDEGELELEPEDEGSGNSSGSGSGKVGLPEDEVEVVQVHNQNLWDLTPWKMVIWVIAMVIGMIMITVQLTLDCDIIFSKGENVEELEVEQLDVEIRRHSQWIKVTSRLLIISALCFSASLFIEWEMSALFAIALFLGLVLRFSALTIAYSYLARLKIIFANQLQIV